MHFLLRITMLLFLGFFLVSCNWNPNSGIFLSETREQESISTKEEKNDQGKQVANTYQENEREDNFFSKKIESILGSDHSQQVEHIEKNIAAESGISSQEENISQETFQNTSIGEKERIMELEDFPSPSKPWRKKFEIKAPNNGFSAIYFDTESGKKSQAETLDTMSISSVGVLGPVSNLENLGAFILGNIYIPSDGKYEFSISQSWAQTRIIIDDRLVHASSENSNFTLFLKEGKHTIEVEHINNWHTAELLVSFQKLVTSYSLNSLKETISPQSGEVWFVGIYEPNTKGHRVRLSIPPSSQSISLILSSYSPTNWIISNPSNAPIRDIVYTSYSPGTSISGVSGVDTYRLSSPGVPLVYKTKPECYDTAGYFHCEGSINDFQNLNSIIEDTYGKKLTGFAGEYYGENGFTLPGKRLDLDGYKEIQKEYQEILKLKRQSENKKTFNNMFDN